MNSFSNILATQKEEKEKLSFYCQQCDFKCCSKYNFDRHINTRKHIKATTSNNKEKKEQTDYFCEHCNKIYETRNGLWRHKKTCNKIIEQKNIDNNEIKLLTELVINVVKQNKELTDKFVDICKTSIANSASNNISNSNNTNSLNKTFNLQFFLNETCKDAMNMTDFVDSIKFQLNDLEKMGDIGYVQGISNIITKNLQTLEVNQRPVHCTDQKRETIYIKDENKWEKEDDNKTKLRKIIQRITNKNMKILPQFREKHPDYDNPALKISDTYDKLVLEVMGGAGNNDVEKENKIIRNIAKTITITKLQEGGVL